MHCSSTTLNGFGSTHKESPNQQNDCKIRACLGLRKVNDLVIEQTCCALDYKVEKYGKSKNQSTSSQKVGGGGISLVWKFLFNTIESYAVINEYYMCSGWID